MSQTLPVVNLDARWKDIIRAHPEAFMQYFFAALSQRIDFSKGVRFLDKELQQLLPGWSKKGQLTGDILMEWHLLSGEKQLVLVH